MVTGHVKDIMHSTPYHDREQMEGVNDEPCLGDKDTSEPIAVVGFSINFPQEATSEGSFWQMLTEGRSAMTEVPNSRFNIDAFYHPNADRLDTGRIVYPFVHDHIH